VLADFYHLSVSPLERVLPRICERLLSEGQRLLIVADPEYLDTLDDQLWSYARDAFLPHGRAGSGEAERQPVLLASEAQAANGARNIAFADGRWRDDALAFDRAFCFFDDSRAQGARASWEALAGKADVERRYWVQDAAGKWVTGP
jgi:DNA polymerase III subunit chi